jgi:hypothetical protein
MVYSRVNPAYAGLTLQRSQIKNESPIIIKKNLTLFACQNFNLLQIFSTSLLLSSMLN